jgi:hypothetical protein
MKKKPHTRPLLGATQRKLVELPPLLHAELALLATGRRTKLKYIVMEAVAAYIRTHTGEAEGYRRQPGLPPLRRPVRDAKGRYLC